MISFVMMSVDPLALNLRSMYSVYSLVLFDSYPLEIDWAHFSSGRLKCISLSSVLKSFKSCTFIDP